MHLSNGQAIPQASSLTTTHVILGAQPYQTALHPSCMRDPSNLTVLLQGLTNHDRRRAVTPKNREMMPKFSRSDWSSGKLRHDAQVGPRMLLIDPRGLQEERSIRNVSEPP
jgi:hypothetical protein